MKFVRTRSVIKKVLPIYKKKDVRQGKYARIKKFLYIWFRINRENISKHAFCLMKFNGMKEEYYFNEIAPKGTQMCIKVMTWGHKSCADLCFLDLKNETFSQYHCHNKFRVIFDFKRFSKILKTARWHHVTLKVGRVISAFL